MGTIENICYGREDLMRASEQMCHDFGNDAVSEELCSVMADAACEFLKQIQRK